MVIKYTFRISFCHFMCFQNESYILLGFSKPLVTCRSFLLLPYYGNLRNNISNEIFFAFLVLQYSLLINIFISTWIIIHITNNVVVFTFLMKKHPSKWYIMKSIFIQSIRLMNSLMKYIKYFIWNRTLRFKLCIHDTEYKGITKLIHYYLMGICVVCRSFSTN